MVTFLHLRDSWSVFPQAIGKHLLCRCHGRRGAGAEIGMCFCKLKTSEVILSDTTPACTCIFEMQIGPPARKNHNSPAALLGRLLRSLYESSKIRVPTTAVEPANSKLVRTTKESVSSSDVAPVARRCYNDRQAYNASKSASSEEVPHHCFWGFLQSAFV
ncbi:MAG: hypothetical protein J3Q66DRAFT_356562 [Benniella sp.]|nr:MAG: hypothetical protein J3Q66DRAFT_356538 [Benniella sp.]KAK3807808.1 MAG: hypothetical protein J3Q66DRAFT_356562 [Benniella sp.]